MVPVLPFFGGIVGVVIGVALPYAFKKGGPTAVNYNVTFPEPLLGNLTWPAPAPWVDVTFPDWSTFSPCPNIPDCNCSGNCPDCNCYCPDCNCHCPGCPDVYCGVNITSLSIPRGGTVVPDALLPDTCVCPEPVVCAEPVACPDLVVSPDLVNADDWGSALDYFGSLEHCKREISVTNLTKQGRFRMTNSY